MSDEPTKLYEVGQKLHHDDNVLECIEVREVTVHDPENGSAHLHYAYTFRDKQELDDEREAAEAARTGHEDAPAEQEQTDIA